MSSSSQSKGISARKFGFWIIGFITLAVFAIKIMTHYGILTGTALSVAGVVIAFLPVLFALSIVLIISMKSFFGNVALFVLVLVLAYLIITPIYLSGL